MKHSLGLLESKGLVALIEAADVILKNSPVEILWVRKLNNGLVTLVISGETDYVKAVMDMAVEAGNKVGEIYSHSIIEDPDVNLLKIFESNLDITKSKVMDLNSQQETAKNESKNFEMIVRTNVKRKTKNLVDHQSEEKFNYNNKKITQDTNQDFKELKFTVIKNQKDENSSESTKSKLADAFSTLERLRREALGITEKDNITEKNIEGENDKMIKSHVLLDKDNVLASIEKMNVHELRRYARAFENFPIKGRQISKANRSKLLNLFKEITS